MAVDVSGHQCAITSMEILELEYRKGGPGRPYSLKAGVALVTPTGTAGKVTLNASLMSPESAMLLEQLLESLERDTAKHIFPSASSHQGVDSF